MQFLRRIYKFMPMRAAFLTNRYIRLTPRLQFNDPYDSLPFEGDIDTLRKNHRTVFRTPSPGDTELLDSHFSGIGIISLTESIYNILMWSHYGDAHKGMAVGLDPRAAPIADIRRVRYTHQRPNLRDNYPGIMGVELFFKSDQWSYEKEWRLVKPLGDCDCILDSISGAEEPSTSLTLPCLPPKLAMLKVPKLAIRSIVLGARSTEVDKNAFIRAINSDPELRHVELQQATLNMNKYEIDLKRIL